jgi:carotenoid cleavage dioxygenase-like enzyme
MVQKAAMSKYMATKCFGFF